MSRVDQAGPVSKILHYLFESYVKFSMRSYERGGGGGGEGAGSDFVFRHFCVVFSNYEKKNSSPFLISETGLKFSLKNPRRNWSRNRARMVNWAHLKSLLVLSEPSIGLLLYRLEVKRGCSSHKAR